MLFIFLSLIGLGVDPGLPNLGLVYHFYKFHSISLQVYSNFYKLHSVSFISLCRVRTSDLDHLWDAENPFCGQKMCTIAGRTQQFSGSWIVSHGYDIFG